MISIVIPLYNKEKYISTTIESVLCQDYSDFELLVVDDGSTDNGPDIVKRYVSEKTRMISKKNGGSASARNLGIKNARGEWIMILDADDTLEQDSLRVFAKIIETHPDLDFFCGNHYLEKEGNKRLYSDSYKDCILRNSFYSWCVGEFMPVAGSCIIKRELLIKYPFKENLRRYEDAESLFNIMRETKIYRTSRPMMTYNLNGNCASKGRKDISEDFIGHLNPKGKSMWEQYALYQLLLQGYGLYPNDIPQLYRFKDFYTWKVRLADFYLKHIRNRKISSFFKF